VERRRGSAAGGRHGHPDDALYYIEEAERLADRVGVINHGEIIIVEEKDKLMRDLGKKQLMLHLYEELEAIPPEFERYALELSEDRRELTYTYDTKGEHSMT
jgi:ABC-2 type transport system ATP-binding protein